MLNKFRNALCLILGLFSASISAEPMPFQPQSLEQIAGARTGQPFLLVLWSVDCPPCIKELSHLQQLRDRFDARSLVLVSTDGPEQYELVEQTLAHFGLETVESWAFADQFPERLRYHIDPEWFGELPRAYFYDTGHQRTATSGTLSLATLEEWLNRTAGADSPH